MTSRQAKFQRVVMDFYKVQGRDLPWRRTTDPYALLVSEVMLQQTQVGRVIPKYHAFLRRFPTVKKLADAPLSAVLTVWSGLGYNRRAKYLHEAAGQLAAKKRWTYDDLVACKGIGPNTAAAIVVYADNRPLVFVETNIRTVFIHHFFADQFIVSDKELLPLIGQTLDAKDPRRWYWALMDYGTHLKTTAGNAARRSRHYAKQSVFEGSRRQIRGQILRLLTQSPRSRRELVQMVIDDRLSDVLKDLSREGFIHRTGSTYRL